MNEYAWSMHEYSTAEGVTGQEVQRAQGARLRG